MQVYLKVKVKSLAEEAHIIRKEERKVKTSRAYRRKAKRLLKFGSPIIDESSGKECGFRMLTNKERDLFTKQTTSPSQETLDIFLDLQSHRKGPLREEARHTHIAYGYLRGFSYEEIEANAKKSPNWDKVVSMISKYGTMEQRGQFSQWLSSAKEYRDNLTKH